MIIKGAVSEFGKSKSCAVIDQSNGEIVRFTSQKQYNVTKHNKKGPFSFVNKADGFKMHFIDFQTNYYHVDTS